MGSPPLFKNLSYHETGIDKCVFKTNVQLNKGLERKCPPLHGSWECSTPGIPGPLPATASSSPHHPDFPSSLPCLPLYSSHRWLFGFALCLSLYVLGQACWARSMAVFFQGGSTGPVPDPLPASPFPPPQALPVPTLHLRRGPPWPPGSPSTGGVPSPPLTTAQTRAGY